MQKTLKRYGLFQFGSVIPGLQILGKPAPYPVVNERAVRAGAGMMFALGFFAFFQAFYLENYTFIKFFVVVFFVDFFMKVLIGTRFSPIGQLANFIVRNQTPEYVGAVQKRFAWSIGLLLASVMLFLIFVLGVTGWPNLLVCGICLTFMFLESAFGICAGCKVYGALLAAGWLSQPEVRPACAGNVCAIE